MNTLVSIFSVKLAAKCITETELSLNLSVICLNNKLLWLTSWCTMLMLLLSLEKEGL